MTSEWQPMTFGQLSVLSDLESVPPTERQHLFVASEISLPDSVLLPDLVAAWADMQTACPAFRTQFDSSGRQQRILHRESRGDDRTAILRNGDPLIESFLFRSDYPNAASMASGGWNALIVDCGETEPPRFYIRHNHMLIDRAAEAIIASHLDTVTRSSRTAFPDDQIDTCRLAKTERDQFAKKRAKLNAHWERVRSISDSAGLDLDRFAISDSPVSADYTMRSPRLGMATRERAKRLGLPEAAVALDAYRDALIPFARRDVVVRCMASNRYTADRERLVATLNQWMPVALSADGNPRTTFRELLSTARLSSYPVICSDPAWLELIPSTSHCDASFNYISSAASRLSSDGLDAEVIAVSDPHHTIGSQIYLRCAISLTGDLHLSLRSPSRNLALEILNRIEKSISGG